MMSENLYTFEWESEDIILLKSPYGKIVLSVGAALYKSFFCPRLVLAGPSFVLFVFLFPLQCLCDALVMSQAYPKVSTYASCCLCQDLFSSIRLPLRLTKEIRKAKHIPQHVLFIGS